MSDEQPRLFDAPPAWAELWEGMPEYKMEDMREVDSIRVYFRTEQDRTDFFELIGDPNTHRRRGVWFPFKPYRRPPERPENVDVPAGRYPIYVISKGRADTRMTSKALELLGIDYAIVVEPQEYDDYARHIDAAKIRVLPFSNLGRGSIPARNWVWEDAVRSGAKRHWILDDNIQGFARLNNNVNRMIVDENPFTACEDFSDRYRNVGLSGLQYRMFASDKDPLPPFRLNTRIYSCILINHALDGVLEERWRGRYNEDTDLSLRTLKAGWCTVLFNAYLCGKAGTMTVKGGNTDELYAGDGRLRMAQHLVDQHPDVATITEKWGRYQHHVDYSPFRFNKLEEALNEDVRMSLLPEDGRPGRGDDGPTDSRLGTEGDRSDPSGRVGHSNAGVDKRSVDV